MLYVYSAEKGDGMLEFCVAVVLMLGVALCLPRQARASIGFGAPTGVLRYDREAVFPGYTILSPTFSTSTYLINMEGEVVHSWPSKYPNGLTGLLQPDGSIYRMCRMEEALVHTGGITGRIQRIAWDGALLWDYVLNDPKLGTLTHTPCVMPNGHLLCVVNQLKSSEEAYAKGRTPGTLGKRNYSGWTADGIVNAYVMELDPTTNEVLWTWHVWDHLGTGPDQVDINCTLPPPATTDESYYRINWLTINGVAYNPTTDEVMLTSRNISEIYIISRKTGKLVWRWGNPANYGAGRRPSFCDEGDQQLWGPHNATWLADGRIQVHDNGWGRTMSPRSRVLVIDRASNKIAWQFQSLNPFSYNTPYQGSAQRLPNGNILVTSAGPGHVFEITSGKAPRVVWEFVTPWMQGGIAQPFLDDTHALCTPGRSRVYPEGHMQNMVHRAYRFGVNDPAFKGRDLSHGTLPHPHIQRYWEIEPWKSGQAEAKKRFPAVHAEWKNCR